MTNNLIRNDKIFNLRELCVKWVFLLQKIYEKYIVESAFAKKKYLKFLLFVDKKMFLKK